MIPDPKHSGLLLAAALFLLTTPLVSQTTPNIAKGFAPDQLYQFGSIDNVNLFNGNLIVTIPIGSSYPLGGGLSYGLVLTFNGKLWDHERIPNYPNVSDVSYRAIPDRRSNAGLGWTISMGRLITPADPSNDGLTVGWQLQTPDGGSHKFHGTLHDGDAGTAGVSYTRDSTYIRMKEISSTEREVEMPDGTIQKFDNATGRLTMIRDRFGNYASITYSADSLTWEIRDQHARVHYVYFRQVTDSQVSQANYRSVLREIDLAGFGGGTNRSRYQFSYSDAVSIERGCRGGITGDPANVYVPLLQSIQLPDASFYRFSNFTDNSTSCRSGSLSSIELPTLGKIEYEYQTYLIPLKGCEEDVSDQSTGIRARQLRNPTGVDLGRWEYTTQLKEGPRQDVMCGQNQWLFNYAPLEYAENSVKAPTGDKTVHYFSTWPFNPQSASGSKNREFGLPFTRLLPEGTRFRSSESHDCDNTGNNCSPKRRTSVVYELDDSFSREDKNRRLSSTQTQYLDDGTKSASVDYSDFDGLGHYRTATVGGTFGNGDSRSSFTNFNPGSDALGRRAGSLTIPASSPWVSNTFTEQSTTEGGITAKSLACFDMATGFLRRQRSLSGPAPAANDVVKILTADGNGNIGQEAYYGGDKDPLSDVSSDLCSSFASGLPPARYALNHTYSFGVLSRSQYQGMPYPSLDLTIDASTGLTSRSRDTTGLETTFQYDLMGRITNVSPAGTAPASYAYTNASSSVPARVTIVRGSGASLTQTVVSYDGLGRVSREESLLPGGSSTRETLYNLTGWKDQIIESPGAVTRFENYDPFGRVGSVRAPDGSITSFSYTGVSSVSRTTALGTTTEVYDRQGRLVEVRELSGSIITGYGYDVGGRLKSVTMQAPEGSQNRRFTYDQRGFLLEEVHPENGTFTYGSYDSRGHAWTKRHAVQGVYDLNFEYDAAERLTRVFSRNPYSPTEFRISKEFAFGTFNQGANLTLGKLEQAVRYNYGPSLGTIKVTETYKYEDGAGRVTKRLTDVVRLVNPPSPSGPTLQQFSQEFTYDEVGLPDRIPYPTCLAIACGQSSLAEVDYSHEKGLTKTIGTRALRTQPNPDPVGFVSDIRYSTSGMTWQIDHSNAVVDTQEIDPFGMRRPKSISFAGSSVCAAPAISVQPQDQAISAGGSTTLSVYATGTGTLSYQWHQSFPAPEGPLAGQTASSFTTPALTATTFYYVRVSNSCGSVSSRVVTVTVTLAAPTNLIASYNGSSVTVSWTPPAGNVSRYTLERRSTGTFADLTTTIPGGATSYPDSSVQSGVGYLYRIRAVDSANAESPQSNIDLATTVGFSNEPLATGTVVYASHMSELRRAVDALRLSAGLGALWSPYTPPAGALIRSFEIQELRTNLNDARGRLGIAVWSFTWPATIGSLIRKEDVQDLRRGVQ